jgi:STE24 endopeptidase
MVGMMHDYIFIAILLILVFDFLFENYLEFLNISRMGKKLPKELEGIYDKEKYARQQSYQKENHRFGMVSGTFSFLLVLGMILFYGFAFVDRIVWQITSSQVLAAMLFFGIVMFVSAIINIPFSVYETFVIEEKYGFNKTTPKTFMLDQVKGLLLGAFIGGSLLALVVFIYQLTQGMFWIYAWIAIALFSIFMTMFYSNLIVPLFNKQTLLKEGELRNAIQQFADKVGFRLNNIYVINGSKRSAKANAYFTGFGRKKRIVLYDTLIDEMEKEEIVAVLAHEIGHYKKKHVTQGLLISLLQTGAVLFLFSLFINSPSLSRALGVEEPNFHIGLVAFALLYSPVSFLLGILMNRLSRKNEFQADAYAAINFNANALGAALKKLTQRNLSNLTPHPLYVFFNYSHPPLLQRLRHLKKFQI